MSQPSNRSVGIGAVAGVGGFLAGYVTTWIVAGGRAASIAVGGPFGGGVPDWKAVLWVYFDAHFVGTGTPRVTGPDGALWGGGDLVDTVSLLGVEYMYVLPVVILILAGGALAARARPESGRGATLAGLTIVAGYLPMAIIGLLVGTEGGVAPSPLRAAVVAGVVYPVACGSIGGYLWTFIREARS